MLMVLALVAVEPEEAPLSLAALGEAVPGVVSPVVLPSVPVAAGGVAFVVLGNPAEPLAPSVPVSGVGKAPGVVVEGNGVVDGGSWVAAAGGEPDAPTEPVAALPVEMLLPAPAEAPAWFSRVVLLLAD